MVTQLQYSASHIIFWSQYSQEINSFLFISVEKEFVMSAHERHVLVKIDTTGVNYKKAAFEENDRIWGIALTEVNGDTIGQTYFTYLNPTKELSEGAQKYTEFRLSDLEKYPTFGEKVNEILAFIADSPLVPQTRWELRMLNLELAHAERPEIDEVHTLQELAKSKKSLLPPDKSELLNRNPNFDKLCDAVSIDANRIKYGTTCESRSQALAQVFVRLQHLEAPRREGLRPRITGADGKTKAGLTFMRGVDATAGNDEYTQARKKFRRAQEIEAQQETRTDATAPETSASPSI
jgi:DNA polymerase-3 subunit epsilon